MKHREVVVFRLELQRPQLQPLLSLSVEPAVFDEVLIPVLVPPAQYS
jgi:hypothetical protein